MESKQYLIPSSQNENKDLVRILISQIINRMNYQIRLTH